MAQKLGLWSYNTLRKAAVLGTIEDQYSSINAHCGYNIRILRLVSRLIDLSGVIYFLFNVHFDGSLFAGWRISITTNFSTIFIIVIGIGVDIFRDFDVGNLSVVLCAVSSMGANQESVHRMVLSRGPVHSSATHSWCPWTC